MKRPGVRIVVRSILIFGYILAVLLISGLARAQMNSAQAKRFVPALVGSNIQVDLTAQNKLK